MITPLAARRGMITSLARGIQRESAAVSWWLSGGISAANCIAAYQAKGAADYAASKVNLANPGTYDATDGVTPTWDASDGWTFNGSTYLKPGITPTSAQVYAIRISLWTDTYYYGLFGTYNSGGNGAYTGAFPINGVLNCYNYGLRDVTCGAKPESGTIIINIDDVYVNGVLVGEVLPFVSPVATDYYIGGFHRVDYSIYRAGHFKCQAFGQWNEQLTSDQVAALHTAMNAL